MIEQRLKHRRHPRHRGRPHPLQRFERLPGLKPRQHRDTSAHGHGAIEHANIGENVEQRQHPQDHIARTHGWINRHDLASVSGDILVREHRALGHPGGPAGILQQGQIVLRIDRHGQQRGGAQQRRPAPHIGAHRDRDDGFAAQHRQRDPLHPREHRAERRHHQLFERGGIKYLQRGRQQRCRINRDQQPRTRIFDLRSQFIGGVKRAEIDHSQPGQHRPIIGRDVNRHVGQVEPDAVALDEAERL